MFGFFLGLFLFFKKKFFALFFFLKFLFFSKFQFFEAFFFFMRFRCKLFIFFSSFSFCFFGLFCCLGSSFDCVFFSTSRGLAVGDCHGLNGVAEGVRLIRGTSTNQPANVDNVLVTADGAELLSRAGRDLVVV